MLIDSLIKIFKRDLLKLKFEIESYQDEGNLWIVDKEIINSAGNLCLHLIGNLNTYIGSDLGNTGYIRQRDLEFSLKDVPRTELIKKIDEVSIIIVDTLLKMNPDDLQKEFSRRVFEEKMTTEYFLIHLTTHLAYHLGQINYHRRLLD